MGMSKSAEATRSWRAGAHVFSGRSDPVWRLTADQSKRLVEIWGRLRRSTGPKQASSPKLGYRGCFVSDGLNLTWLAMDGIVTLSGPESVETRDDPNRRFEQETLASAPAGILPETFGGSR